MATPGARSEVGSLAEPSHSTHVTAFPVACALFVPTGLITVLLGPLLPALSSRWSLSDTESGYVIAAQFVGCLAGTLASGFFVSRVGFRGTMAGGVGLMTLGTATLMLDAYVWGIAAVACYGIGIGVTVPTANLLVAQASGERRSSSLNLLNFFWSAGAVACPFVVAAFRGGEQFHSLLTVLVTSLALIAATLFVVPIHGPDPGEHPAVATDFQLTHPRRVVLALFALLFFVYVGTESALGAWLASYAKRSPEIQGGGWITIPAYFYGALLFGRLAASLTLKKVLDITQARLGAVLASVSVGLLLYARTFTGIAVSAAFIGLGLSTLYPIAIGFASVKFGAASSRMMGALFAFATLGAAVVPWLVGFVSTRFGGLRIALLVPFAGSLLMAGLFCNAGAAKSSLIPKHDVASIG